MAFEIESVLREPYAVMTIGIPGSGKSTFAEQLADTIGLTYLNTDRIRGELSGDESDQSVNKEAWELLRERAQRALTEGDSIMVDATHTVEVLRGRDVKLYRRFGAQSVIGLYFPVSLDVAWQRIQKRQRHVPREVLEGKHRQLHEGRIEDDPSFDQVLPFISHK